MTVSRHPGFYQTGNSAIRSADPEKPGLEPNMEWMGCTVCDIFTFELYGDLESGFRGSLKVIESGTVRWSTYDFIFVFYSKYASIYYRFRDIAAYWSKIAIPLYPAPPLGVRPSDSRTLGDEKTTMMGLSDREGILMIHSAVLIQSTYVTDGQTDRLTN